MNNYKHILLFSIILVQCRAQSDQVPMTTELWREDIEYLNKKIQKEFASFVPGIKKAFKTEVDKLKKQLPRLENYEVACEIQRILSTLQDGHTELNIGHPNVGFHRLPISLYFFEGELYILAAQREYEDLIGGKLIGIGNVSASEAFSRVKNNMSHDNDMEYLHAAPGYILLLENLMCLGIIDRVDKVTLDIELSNRSIEKHTLNGIDYEAYQQGDWVTLHSKENVETPLYLSQTGTRYWFQHLPEQKTMYFNFSRVNNQRGKPSIKKFTKQLFERIDEVRPEQLVIDFRRNNGGNYNLSRPLIEAIKARDWLNQKGKVWAITGRRTFSAASTACIFLKQETNALIIGEVGRTHPNWADNNEYLTLPNSKFLIEYTTKVKVHWPEQPDLDHIPVDVEIIPTFSAYAEGRDLVLEYIFKGIDENRITR